MKDSLMTEIMQHMASFLDNAQMMQLQKVLEHSLFSYEISLKKDINLQEDGKQNQEYLELFLSAKHIEGCSDKSLKYYRSVLENMPYFIELFCLVGR